jgi:hypothetical protein
MGRIDREWDRWQVCEKPRTDKEAFLEDLAALEVPARSSSKLGHERGGDTPPHEATERSGLTFSFGLGLNVTVPVGGPISASASSASFAVLVDTAGSKAVKVCSPTIGPAVGAGISVAEVTVQGGLLPKGATLGVEGITSSVEVKASATGMFLVMPKASYGVSVSTAADGDIQVSAQPELGLAFGIAAVAELSATGCVTIDVTHVVDRIISR